jgi:hypothetical protein
MEGLLKVSSKYNELSSKFVLSAHCLMHTGNTKKLIITIITKNLHVIMTQVGKKFSLLR